MSLHRGAYKVSSDILPSQVVPLSEKIEKPSKDPDKKTWSQKNMDALESIGRTQYFLNLPIIENYEMIKGRFIFSHYFKNEGYQGLLAQLSEDVELPNYLRHYDIIGQVLNTMSGEWQKRPDIFKVKHVGDSGTNEYLRTKEELFANYVFEKINTEIERKLAEQGIDTQREEFESPEQQEQYYQELDSMKKSMTPQEIQKHMDSDFMTLAEIWGNHHKEKSKEYFNLPEKEKVEIEDMFAADRCFRHYFLDPGSTLGYVQETWNPVHVFFHKSPDVNYVEDGDYVGRIFHLSINTIIDRYGHLMTHEDFKILQGKADESNTKWNDHKYGWVYDDYLVPFKHYPEYNAIKQHSPGVVPPVYGIPELTSEAFSTSETGMFRENEGFYFVTEAYWKTQKKLFKLTYLDEDGELVVKIVDELYDMPKHFKESDKVFTDDHDIDTYCVTYVNEVWKGIKINTSADKDMDRDLYLDIGPNEFQFKGTYNMYGCKLPVCGQVFSVRNSGSMSLVDLMKPYQIAYNVAMNQVFNLMEKEIGMFVVMDVNMFPNSKDWGGSDSWEKWMLFAKNVGMIPADTSPANIRNSLAATGGFLPKVIDLDLASRMVSRMNLCKFFEEQALKQVGFNEYRLGSYASSATATGVEQGTSASFSQTESYFTNFSNYLKRCYQMDLEIAQYVESQKETIDVLYSKNDTSKTFVKILGAELLLSDLGVFVSNSQEHLRQLEMLRQYALTNNTTNMDPSAVADIIMMNSPKEIRKSLEKAAEKYDLMQQQAQQAETERVQSEIAFEREKIEAENKRHEDKLQNNLDVAYIKEGSRVIASTPDVPNMPEDDSFDKDLENQKHVDNMDIQRRQMESDRELRERELDIKQDELRTKRYKIDADREIQEKETHTARILKGRDKDD